MKRIMFNKEYEVQDKVFNKTKTHTSRLVTSDQAINELLIDSAGLVFGNYGLHSLKLPRSLQPKYMVGDIVAVCQSYSEIYDEIEFDPSNDIYKAFHAEFPQLRLSEGWNNKMYVRADIMPHKIQITNLIAHRIQQITPNLCLKEGVSRIPFADTSHYLWDLKFAPIKIRQKLRDVDEDWFDNAVDAFKALFVALYGQQVWDDNPFVYGYDFKLLC